MADHDTHDHTGVTGVPSATAPNPTTIELGHASDTTLSRASAGVVAVEGTNLVKAGAITTSGLTQATARLLGRNTASTGAVEEITLGTNLSFSGTTLNASGGGSALVGARVFSTAGDLTTSSTTVVDVTGATVTITTGAHSVAFSLMSACEISSVPQDVCIDVDIDGTLVTGGAIRGLYDFQIVTTGRRHPVAMVGSSATLTAGSHTIKAQWFVTGGTGTLYRSSTVPLIWTVWELPF